MSDCNKCPHCGGDRIKDVMAATFGAVDVMSNVVSVRESEARRAALLEAAEMALKVLRELLADDLPSTDLMSDGVRIVFDRIRGMAEEPAT